METSKRLTIFEGCDGTGKSTAAQHYAEVTGALYVHLPALKSVTSGLGRLYVEAMLPALLGYQDVVMDRCWLSEVPYGTVFREGQDRLGAASVRMLERLALRCATVVVLCDPGLPLVQASFMKRKQQELLTDLVQLQAVHEIYRLMTTSLPLVRYDYDKRDVMGLLEDAKRERMRPHPLAWRSAGSYYAKTIVVGEAFAERKNDDPWYQWPFASFSKLGCSQWLTEQLRQPEHDLFWINADQDLTMIKDRFWLQPTDNTSLTENRRHVVALGDVAARQLKLTCGDSIHVVKLAHPQHHKRFSSAFPYGTRGLL